MLILLIFAAAFLGGWRYFSVGGDADAIIGSPVSTTPTSLPAAGSSTSTDTQTPSTIRQSTTGDLRLDSLLGAIGLSHLDSETMVELRDLIGDAVDSIFGVIPAYQGSDIDIAQTIAMLATVDSGFVENAFGNTVYPCGDPDPLVVCAAEVLEMPVGDMLIVAVQMDDDVPTDSSDRSFVYSIVFDSDGDPGNDWVFNPPFDWDYFQGADRWYQGVYDHTSGSWVVDVTQLSADGSIPGSAEASAVRLVIEGPWVVWFIPASEFASYPAPFRVSAFGHDGFFSEPSRGGDVSGVDPTEPLSVPPSEPAFVSGN